MHAFSFVIFVVVIHKTKKNLYEIGQMLTMDVKFDDKNQTPIKAILASL